MRRAEPEAVIRVEQALPHNVSALLSRLWKCPSVIGEIVEIARISFQWSIRQISGIYQEQILWKHYPQFPENWQYFWRAVGIKTSYLEQALVLREVDSIYKVPLECLWQGWYTKRKSGLTHNQGHGRNKSISSSSNHDRLSQSLSSGRILTTDYGHGGSCNTTTGCNEFHDIYNAEHPGTFASLIPFGDEMQENNITSSSNTE